MRQPARFLIIGLLFCFALSASLFSTSAQDATLTPTPEAQSDQQILPITQDIIYTVRPADTMDSIGALFDVEVECLAKTNQIDNRGQIAVGQKLTVSVACPPYDGERKVETPRQVFTGEAACKDGYLVKTNDTLDVIAQQLNISVVSLKLANHIDTSRDVKKDMCLTIPKDAPPYGVYPATDQKQDNTAGQGGGIAGKEYVIQPNDNLDIIGQKYNVSVVALQLANHIRTKREVTPGKTIIIPDGAPPYGVYPPLCPPYNTAVNVDCPPVDQTAGQGGGGGQVYVVQPRDTLNQIGAKLDADVKCIAEGNTLTNGLIYAGQTLIISADCPKYTGDQVIPPLSSVVQPASQATATAPTPETTPEGGSG